MKAGWQISTLGDVLAVLRNGVNCKQDKSGKGDKISRIESISDASFDFGKVGYAELSERDRVRYRLQKDDILFSHINSAIHVGKTAVFDSAEAVYHGVNLLLMRPKNVVTPAYLDHALKYIFQSGYWRDVCKQSVNQASVNQQDISRVQISYPESLPEQQRIVGILDEAFDCIAIAKANAEKNLQNARDLYESSLNSAITGKLTQEWRCAHPNTESASVHLEKKLLQRRSQWKGPGQFREPNLAVTNKPLEIPNNWTLASPEQISTHIVDCPHSTPKWSKSGVICLRTTNFRPGILDLQSVQFVSEDAYNERIMRLEPKPDDVLYSREGGILGIACTIPKHLKACLGQRMMLFRLDTIIVLPEYFTSVLNSTLILSEVKRLTGGAAAPHLNIRDIRTFPIPLPPIVEQHKIVETLYALTAETTRLASIYQQKLTALNELKKSLLHRAFNGDL